MIKRQGDGSQIHIDNTLAKDTGARGQFKSVLARFLKTGEFEAVEKNLNRIASHRIED